MTFTVFIRDTTTHIEPYTSAPIDTPYNSLTISITQKLYNLLQIVSVPLVPHDFHSQHNKRQQQTNSQDNEHSRHHFEVNLFTSDCGKENKAQFKLTQNRRDRIAMRNHHQSERTGN